MNSILLKLRSVPFPFILLLAFVINAQNYKFKDVTANDLLTIEDSVFPEANAVILYRDVLFKYGHALYFSERIKIYKKEGFEYLRGEKE